MDESAGKRRSTRVPHGAPWLKTILVQAAWSAARAKHGYLKAQFLRLRSRRGPKKAVVAVAASLLTAVYYILRAGTTYRDLGGHYFDRLDKQRTFEQSPATRPPNGPRRHPHASPSTRRSFFVATLKTDPLATSIPDPRRNGVCRSTSGGSTAFRERRGRAEGTPCPAMIRPIPDAGPACRPGRDQPRPSASTITSR